MTSAKKSDQGMPKQETKDWDRSKFLCSDGVKIGDIIEEGGNDEIFVAELCCGEAPFYYCTRLVVR